MSKKIASAFYYLLFIVIMVAVLFASKWLLETDIFFHPFTDPLPTNIGEEKIEIMIHKVLNEYITTLLSICAILLAVLGGIIGFVGNKLIQKYIKKSVEAVNFEQRILTEVYAIDKNLFDEKNDRIAHEHKIKNMLAEALKNDNEKTKRLAELSLGIIYDKGWEKTVIDLCKPYEDMPMKLNYRTWSNYAIANMNGYNRCVLSDVYKEHTFKGCKNSLNNHPVYGVPYAIEIIIYAIDYRTYKNQERNKNNDDKLNEIYKLIEGQLNSILIQNYEYTIYDLYNYLTIKTQPQWIVDIVKLLNELFPEKMEKLKTIANTINPQIN